MLKCPEVQSWGLIVAALQGQRSQRVGQTPVRHLLLAAPAPHNTTIGTFSCCCWGKQ